LRRGVDARVERHVVDHAGELQRGRHRDEAALAEVDDLPARGDGAPVCGAQLDGEHARVERLARDRREHGEGR
jgi:hypothetical protein